MLLVLGYALELETTTLEAKEAAADSDKTLTPKQILQQVIAHSGGDIWHHPKSLYLEGYAVFFPGGDQASRNVADDYKMWRRFAARSDNAHLANGMVRIDSFAGDTALFQLAFDGVDAYNQKGKIPGGAANPQWRNSFGFGVIRYALNDGFELKRLPDDSVNGHACYMLKVIDPAGGETIFGIDKKVFAARMVGFQTDRGWHHRTYSDFVVDPDSGWRQPRLVKLYYQGEKSNEVHWQRFEINQDYPDSLFRLPASRP